MSFAHRIAEEVRPFLDLLEGSPDPVFVTDSHNRLVAWNRSAERLLGYGPEEALGMSCSALMGGCDGSGNRYCSEHCPLVDMAGRGDVVRHFDLRLRPRSGPPLCVDVNILQLTAPPPHHFYLVHILKPSDRELRPQAAREEPETPPRAAVLSARESPDVRARKLTQREVEILGLVAAGRTSAEIASLLHISTLTVRNHTQNILDKLEVHSKAEAVAFAFQKHLV
ncbi:MAG: PAS domain-containing protein [Geothrix sp.]|uniref:helix-turn-helix transcriptional regulator n=1 Tax=Geothrix sp. TaxID=1962974 RepID=UPI0017B3B2A7|nr:LuxR C-terminal-related transcriptional regulator [Geothrix sp.]NWJ41986.1 PAS domain-containing protein [Geothrix sp.]WIL20042.1 MAG: LuxR C-terminal-related transcriptional regulator [Geothrix sp.]